MVLFLLLSSSCTTLKSTIKGIWTIEEIEFEKNDIIFEIVLGVLKFDEGSCELPEILPNSYLNELNDNEDGFWKITYDKSKDECWIEFKTENEIFRGLHNVCFIEDKEFRKLYAYIYSKDLSVVLNKWYHLDNKNFELNKCVCNYNTQRLSMNEN